MAGSTTATSKTKSKKSTPAEKSKKDKQNREAAVGNLIDFGDTTPALANGEDQSEGWDNEAWANEDEDDAWEALEIEPRKSRPVSTGKAGKGD